jgi:2-dehydro-3-deoxygalactonokinase
MTRAALIALDWGTTSFRAYLVDSRGATLDRRTAVAGIMQIQGGDFEGTFEREVGPWLERAPDLPVIVSGMITSRQGWVEVPYLPCPAGVHEIARALHKHATARGRTVHFVPGLSLRAPDGMPDVLRGEETQIVGALVDRPSAGLFLLPGTHSKWLRVEGGRIAWFATFMTGELFAVLRQHSILGRLIEGEAHDDAAFQRGARYGLDAGAQSGGLLKRLFSARTLGLMGDIEGTGVSSYLSGLLLGSEVREALGCVSAEARDQGVVLVGGSELVARYAEVLALAGVPAGHAAPDAAARGLFRIAETGGLLE